MTTAAWAPVGTWVAWASSRAPTRATTCASAIGGWTSAKKTAESNESSTLSLLKVSRRRKSIFDKDNRRVAWPPATRLTTRRGQPWHGWHKRRGNDQRRNVCTRYECGRPMCVTRERTPTFMCTYLAARRTPAACHSSPPRHTRTSSNAAMWTCSTSRRSMSVKSSESGS